MTQEPAPRRARLLKGALAVSLALNLLVVGAIGGALWRQGGMAPHHREAGAGPRSYAAPYVQALPRDMRRALHQKLRESAPRASTAARQADHAAMLSVLRADPFDRAAAAAVLEAQGSAARESQEAAQAAWLDLVATMGPEERRSYAEALAARLEERDTRRRPKR